MKIYVYSDESGVFDKIHNDYFVFAGIIIIGDNDKIKWSNKYISAEKNIKHNYQSGTEIKACRATNNDKRKLFNAMKECYKFCAIINQKNVHDKIFADKKSKQRYLDYVYKIAIKRALKDLISKGILNEHDPIKIYFNVDQHSTATDGRYELREALEQELKIGTTNYKYMTYYPPIFANIKELNLNYCNSEKQCLIRASDIIANRIYYCVTNSKNKNLREINNLNINYFP